METSLIVDLSTSLGDFTLDLSFSATRGVLGLLGPSGSGKSMTLKSIAGIFTCKQGKIEVVSNDQLHVFFDSKQRINLKPQKRRVGYLFQNYALFPNMNVEENIQVGIQEGNKQEIVQEMIRKFQLTGLEKHYPNELSGGQQQRVALARIFAYHPDILLLDEPFSAMDVHLRERLRLELNQLLKEYNGICILVTHDRDEAYQLCDTLALIDQGHLIRIGKTKEVFEDPRMVTAARLTGCKNISRIERIDSYHVRALDWNDLVLTVKQEVSDQISHIGIRAHDFKAVSSSEGINVFPSGKVSIQEMPFEWYITFENGLWYKVEKSIHESQNDVVVSSYYTISPEYILLLEEGKK